MQGFAPGNDPVCGVLLGVQADGEAPDQAGEAGPGAALLPALGSCAARERRRRLRRCGGAL